MKKSAVKEPTSNTWVMLMLIEIFNFSGRTIGLGGRGAHRQPQVSSTVLLQIQTGSFGEPPTPSSSDLTVALDWY